MLHPLMTIHAAWRILAAQRQDHPEFLGPNRPRRGSHDPAGVLGDRLRDWLHNGRRLPAGWSIVLVLGLSLGLWLGLAAALYHLAG